MTRLENQIGKMQAELNKYIEFSTEMHALFISDLNKSIIPILKQFKTGVVEPCENTYVDTVTHTESQVIDGITSVVHTTKLVYRIILDVNVSNLSDRQITNMEIKFKNAGISMPICPIANNRIQLYYSKNY